MIPFLSGLAALAGLAAGVKHFIGCDIGWHAFHYDESGRQYCVKCNYRELRDRDRPEEDGRKDTP